jgi:hypothetical protein
VRYTPGNILAVTKQYAVITLPTHFWYFSKDIPNTRWFKHGKHQC